MQLVSNKYILNAFFLSCLILPSCMEEDKFLEIREPEIIETENDDYLEQNQWIYTVMKEYYLWNYRLKDSLQYNYSLEPSVFFESMRVEGDRFSYWEVNDDYVITKGVNLNETVRLDSIYTVGDRSVGYFYYTEFATEADVTDIILKFQDVDEVIVDVRDNPGGLIYTCRYLSSLLIPEEAANKVFCSYEYNPTISARNKLETGDERKYDYFLDTPRVEARRLNLDRVYFLTGKWSASCSELIINCLRPYMQVVTIGETTVGKDVGMRTQSSRRCKYVLHPITFRTYNSYDEPVPTTGIVPDIYVEDTNPELLGSTEEPLLGRALQEIINN